VIRIADQPLAERVLNGTLARGRVPQQFLFFGPAGTGKRAAANRLAHHLIGMPPHEDGRPSLDLSVVRAAGALIRLEELDEALRDLASRPVVGQCRVAIIEDAHRFSADSGSRVLKPLEEPAPGSHVILVTDRPEDLLPTIRSRCLPVPFRTPGWRTVRDRLTGEGEDADTATSLARAEGARALVVDPFTRRMHAVGVRLGLEVLRGDRAGGAMVAETQAAMDRAAADSPSEELQTLRRAAAGLAGKRGERTAVKRAEDQEKRERRRLTTDGWDQVLRSAAGVVADGLALALGADGALRHPHLADEMRSAAASARFCERALEDMEHTRGTLALNPTADAAAEALLVRIALARRGEHVPLVPPGRMPW
jgi:DNA polymerase III subunit delta'